MAEKGHLGLEAPRRQNDPPGPKSKMKAPGLVKWELAKNANDGRIWPEAMKWLLGGAMERPRGPIGHKRYDVTNWPQLGSRLDCRNHQGGRSNSWL
ncbi:hypothetical protein O181_130689 [Austropuccinia psidii MF-1]|uniref:Uncharacterized protein n=1 Tax=Austropuccinia psidii MF-1 TaxID=1389203 RepID=A0A9Q3QAB9_9BASI|nr:hypothetical protein [Austropuccinia psidii MF-1]